MIRAKASPMSRLFSLLVGGGFALLLFVAVPANAQQDARARWKEADIAFNVAYKKWIYEMSDKSKLCHENGKDMTFTTECFNAYMAPMKTMMSGCASERDLRKKEDCFNKSISDLNAIDARWYGDNSRATEPFSFADHLFPVEEKKAEPAPSRVAVSQPAPRPAPSTTKQARTINVSAPGAAASKKCDLSSINLNRPSFAQNLCDGRHEVVQIEGAPGFAYGYGAYVRGFAHCPHLKTSSLSIYRIHRIVDTKFWLDVLGLNHQAETMEEIVAPVLLTTQWWIYVSGGIGDIEIIVDAYKCDSIVTRNFIAEAEKLTEKLLSTDIGLGGVKAYKRPVTLNGLPEATQKLYDEYHLCKVRTGQSDHLGSFGPCDEALYQFQVAEAKATGNPPPTKDPINYWRSTKGPLGQYKERPFSTDVIFYEAPGHFTPEIPDTRDRGKRLNITLEYNSEKPNKLAKVRLASISAGGVYGYSYNRYSGRARSIVEEDNRLIGNLGNDVILECLYTNDGRTHNEIVYWFQERPELADPDRLRKRMPSHPLLLVQGVADECPATLTQEALRRRTMLFDQMRSGGR
jgi:hypothetical protein